MMIEALGQNYGSQFIDDKIEVKRIELHLVIIRAGEEFNSIIFDLFIGILDWLINSFILIHSLFHGAGHMFIQYAQVGMLLLKYWNF